MRHRFQSCSEFDMAIANNSGTISVDTNRCSISVGRGDCDIKIYDPQNKVSSHHADIEYVVITGGSDKYIYIDRSTNGTMINGKRIHRQSKEVFVQNVHFEQHETSGYPDDPEVDKCPEILLACNQNYKLDWVEVIAAFEKKQCKPEPKPVVTPLPKEIPIVVDQTLSFGWYLLAFICPIVGWVMYYQWKENNKGKANKICVTSWISFALGLVLNILMKS